MFIGIENNQPTIFKAMKSARLFGLQGQVEVTQYPYTMYQVDIETYTTDSRDGCRCSGGTN